MVNDVAHIPPERIREVVIQKPGQAAVCAYKSDPKDSDYTLDGFTYPSMGIRMEQK